MRDGDDAYLDAVVKEVLRVRPVLSIAARRVVAPFEVGGHVLPAGVHVAPCIYLAHRRPEAWPEPTAFRPERFLGAAPEPGTYLPFGGGVRRCAGAAFAALELREVLRAVLARFALAPRGRRRDRADDPRLGHAAPSARWDRLDRAATTIEAVSLFCRHNRLTANCPICSREQQEELRAKAPPSPPRTRSSSGAAKRARQRLRRPQVRRRHAPRRPRRRRRLPQRARARPARHRRRRAARRAR